MTDLNDWRSLVHVGRILNRNFQTGESYDPPSFSDYVLVPLTPYHLGNLCEALAQSKDTGDWFYEVQYIIKEAMWKSGIKELHANSGKTFKFEDIGNIRGRI